MEDTALAMGTASAEADLIRRLQSDDDDAFADLVRTHGGRMLATARRILGNDDDAQEAVQEAFLAAARGIASFQGASQLSTWLHRIAVNASLARLRQRQRRQEQGIDELLPTFLSDGHQTVSAVEWRESSEEYLQRQETREFVRRCIDNLPEPFRVVLLLRDIEELEMDEIGRLLELNVGAVKTRLHRARQALRTLLDGHFRRGAL